MFQQTLHFLLAASGRERNTLDELQKNALMPFTRGYSAFRFSIQFPSRIPFAIDSQFALCLVWARHNKSQGLRAVSQGNPGVFFKACQGEEYRIVHRLTFPPQTNKEDDGTTLKDV